MRRRVFIAMAVIILGAPIALMRSNPLEYCGYCQHHYSEQWSPGNAYPCSFWRYVYTKNSSDFTLYFNTPGG